MNEEKKYSEVSDKYVWQSLAIILMILIGGIGALILLTKWVVLPNVLSFINWFVPNFWNCFCFIIILWIVYKFFSLLWTPIYFLLGKWSYLILLATIIYIAMGMI